MLSVPISSIEEAAHRHSWNEMGHAWSGSAVIDHDNSSGLFPEQGSGMIAYYTSFNPSKPNGDQKVGLAYSKDEGRSWQFHEGNPDHSEYR